MNDLSLALVFQHLDRQSFFFARSTCRAWRKASQALKWFWAIAYVNSHFKWPRTFQPTGHYTNIECMGDLWGNGCDASHYTCHNTQDKCYKTFAACNGMQQYNWCADHDTSKVSIWVDYLSQQAQVKVIERAIQPTWMRDPMQLVFRYLHKRDIYAARKVCRVWRSASESIGEMWRPSMLLRGPRLIADNMIHDNDGERPNKCRKVKGKCQTVSHYRNKHNDVVLRRPVVGEDNAINVYKTFALHFGARERNRAVAEIRCSAGHVTLAMTQTAEKWRRYVKGVKK